LQWRPRRCRLITNAHRLKTADENVTVDGVAVTDDVSGWCCQLACDPLNVLQPWDGGRLRLAMYLATVVWPTSMPSLRSSPWMRSLGTEFPTRHPYFSATSRSSTGVG
jgi:hypothetical protein